MSHHLDLGREGEDAAADFLTSEGFQILHRNWRTDRLEVDVIATEGDILCFIEVKTRTDISTFDQPDLTLGVGKGQNLLEAAEQYLIKNGLDLEVRFDLLLVMPGHKTSSFKLIKDLYLTDL
jgi:putative endonuclease